MCKMNSKSLFIYSIGLIALIIGLNSCQRTYVDPLANKGVEYYPLEIGKYILYDVDSTYWDDFLREEIPIRWQMRYECVDTFRDHENRLSYIVNVYRRPAATYPFEIDNVIHVTPTEKHVEFYQKNIGFIAMVFPVANGKSWNGLALINTDKTKHPAFKSTKWNYHYEDVDKKYFNGIENFESTITIMQIDEQINNPDVDSTVYAEKIYGKEIYAKDVGLVYKEFVYWTFDPKMPGSPATGFRKGSAVVMKAVDHN